MCLVYTVGYTVGLPAEEDVEPLTKPRGVYTCY